MDNYIVEIEDPMMLGRSVICEVDRNKFSKWIEFRFATRQGIGGNLLIDQLEAYIGRKIIRMV